LNTIVHITTVHNRYDIRIFHKQCKSLSERYSVFLIVADGLGNEVKDNVEILDIGKRQKSRLKRFTIDSKKAYKKAIEIDANLYHFHDPELMPVGLMLLRKKKKVVFDAHEDLPKQLLSKPYLNKYTSKLLAFLLSIVENSFYGRFDHIIAATPSIKAKFLAINSNTIDINNFPLLDDFTSDTTWENRAYEICFVGGISKIRGIIPLIDALDLTDNCTLNLVGKFGDSNLKREVEKRKGWEKVNEFGFLDRKQVNNVLNTSRAGIVTFLSVPNHTDAQPNKMFEYMSAGLPVIASNFKLWRQIIEKNQCGICVDPENPSEIANAIKYLLSNHVLSKQMGLNGRQAVEEIYNWKVEEKKLFDTYQQLLDT
jgi:glycosyltransferase involved in cell wall biosynthesis